MFVENDIFINDGIASSYERLNFRYEKLFDPVKKHFHGAVVLDIGCHNGRWDYVSLKLGAKKVFGIEKDKDICKKAESMLFKKGFLQDQFSFINQDVNYFDRKQFPDIDIVLCMGILYYLDDPISLLKKIALMKPKLVVIDTFQGVPSGGNVPKTEIFEKHLESCFGNNVKKVVTYDNGNRISFHCGVYVNSISMI